MELALDGSPRAFSSYLFSHYSTLVRLGGSGLSNLWANIWYLDDDGFATREPSGGPGDGPEGKGKDGKGVDGKGIDGKGPGTDGKGPGTDGKGEVKAKARKRPKQRLILGLPKLAWALIADVLAMLAFVACIPFVLTVAKRRRNSTPSAA